MSGLLGKLRVEELQKGIHDNCVYTRIDTKTRTGSKGIIPKMLYLKVAKMDFESNKKLAEVEVSWWKPDVQSDFFKDNLQQLCLQAHNIVASVTDEESAFKAFINVFEGYADTLQELENKKWKKSEVDVVLGRISTVVEESIKPHLNKKESAVRVKLTTNFKGEGVEVPKYNKFIEPMSVEKTSLQFTQNELRTHSKQGVTESKDAPKSTDINI